MPPRREITLLDSIADLRSDFRMGKDSRFHSRLRGVDPSGSGADYHYRNERQWLHMLERARFYRRDDQVVAQGVRRLIANVVQEGFQPDPQTGDDGANAELKARWNDWSTNPDRCHSEQELNFQQIERMTFDAVVTDGDVVHLPLKDGSLQPIEAHRMRTPTNTTKNVVHGVHLNDLGRRLQYWITHEDIGLRAPLSRVADVARYDARDDQGHRQVFHVYDPVRFSQRRGVTTFAPISFTIGAHDDVQFAALVKQQIGNLIAILRERDTNFDPSGKGELGKRTLEDLQGYIRTIEAIGAGLDVASAPGEKLKMFSANVPGPGFKEHSLLILTFIAINLDLPLAVLLLDPSNTNFSGWRGAMDQARLRFRQLQQWFVGEFHRPVWRWKIRQWLAEDPALRKLFAAGQVDPFAHRWNCPGWNYIEPLKDAAADELQDQKLLNSKRRIQSARGRDWDEVSTEIVQDNAQIIRKALAIADEINAQFPQARLNWREVLRLPTADTVTASLKLGSDAPAQETADAA